MRVLFHAVAIILVAFTAFGADPSTSENDLRRLVDDLGHDSFHRRQSAAATLVSRVAAEETDSSSLAALRDGLRHPSLEVRVASDRLLRRVQLGRFDKQIEYLLNPRVDPREIKLSGWQAFSDSAGSDVASRSLFARIAQQHSAILDEMREDRLPTASTSPIANVDPYRIARGDAVTWAFVLSVDLADTAHVSHLSPRIAMSLSNSALGPRIDDPIDRVVVRRLISQWLVNHQREGSARERLQIAMRYGCHDRAIELCDQVFANPATAPSTQVMAMLCGCVLKRPDIEACLIARLDDQRTAHVWQLIVSRRTKIRTQVRDVALTLLLHRHGIDPRSVGFEELQADPIFVFRDHSLGFGDDASRDVAHAKGAQLLGVSREETIASGP